MPLPWAAAAKPPASASARKARSWVMVISRSGYWNTAERPLAAWERWSSAARVRSMTMAPMGVGTMPPERRSNIGVAELALQLGEALRQGGLREADAFGGGRDRAFLRNGEQGAQMPQESKGSAAMGLFRQRPASPILNLAWTGLFLNGTTIRN
jgi:hypothetical protein